MSKKIRTLKEESNNRFFTLFKQSPSGILIIDPESLLPVEFNSAAHNQLGYTRSEFEQLRIQDYETKETSQEIARRFTSVLKHGLETYETIFRTKLGELRFVHVSIQPLVIDSRKYLHCIYEDITNLHETEEINSAKSELLKICNFASSRQELLRNLISFFKTFTQCEAVGIRLQKNEDYPYFESSGFSENHMKLENSLCSFDESGNVLRDSKGSPILEGIYGNIIYGHFDPGKPFFTDHGSFYSSNTTQLLATTADSDRMTHTLNRCIGEGYESVALIPIRLKEKTFGLFQFNDKRTEWFTAGKIETLEHLVDYVAIALAKLDAEDALAVSEQSFKEIFNSTTEAIFIHDADTGQVLDVNETMLKIYGFASKEEAISKNRFEFISEESPFSGERALELVHKATAEGPQVFEWLARKSDGTLFWSEVALNTSNIGGKTRVLAVVRDISERKHMEEALNDSMERYRLLFEEMTEGFALHEIILNVNGKPIDYRFLDINPAFEKQTGLKREAIIGRTVREVLPDTEMYWIEKYGEVALQGGNIHYENYSSALGKWFNVIAFCPKFGQFAVTFEDITDRKANELALYESEEQFRSIFEQASIGMTMVSPEGIFLRVNKAFCQMCGYSSAEMVGNSISLITHPDDMQISDKKLKQPLSEANQNVQFEKRYVHKNGQIVWVSISSSLIRDSKRNPMYFITQAQDITERRTAQEALQLRDKIFTHSLDMLFVAGDNGFFKVLNPAWENNLGWSIEELTSKPWLDFVHPDDRGITETINAQKLDNGYEIIQFENRYLCKDGTIKWLSWNAYPYPEENIIIGAARDITSQKITESQIREQLDELQRWNTVTLGRESRILELKQEVNQLLLQQKQPPRYESGNNSESSHE